MLPRRPRPMLIAFITVAIDLLGFGLVLPLLPVYADQLMPDYPTLMRNVLIGLLMASFSAMQFIFAPWWGRASDWFGRRPILLVGLAGSVFCYGLFALASWCRSVALLFVARIGAGICGATIGTAQAVIADCTPPERRAAGMAWIGMAFGIGFTIGPVIGALSLAHEGDGASVVPGVIAASLSLLAFLLAWWFMPETRKGEYSAARAWWPTQAWKMALARRATALPILTFFLTTLAFASFESILARYAQDEIFAQLDASDPTNWLGLHQWSRQTRICLLFAYVGVVLMLMQGLVVRQLVVVLGELALVRLGIGLMLSALALMVVWSAGGALMITLGALALAVSGFACCTPSLQALVSRGSEPMHQGQILGVNQSAASLSRILGPLLGNALYGPKHGSHQLPYYAAGLLLLVAFSLTLALRSPPSVPVSQTMPSLDS
ncbi:MAG: MFS transporter [Gemmatales bacterium]|nr:MFS transporter [Gemmatales bacterium]MDW7994429.1 MFS transporter [Gemmatales bacterium]